MADAPPPSSSSRALGRLGDVLREANAAGRAAFVPFFTAGDPSLEWTARYLRQMADAGADIIELGIPFSDPIADGPTNQAAAERALKSGTTLPAILDMLERVRSDGFTTPVIVFTYFNPLLRMGVEAFAKRAAAAGADGVLVVDLPPEEARGFTGPMHAHGLDTVFLASPTTPPVRLLGISNASSGFVYYVSRLGVTGAQTSLSATLADELQKLREHVDKPVAVGFGISTPDQAAEVARHADGVVVGSALVKQLESASEDPEGAGTRMAELAASLRAALEVKRE